MGVTMVPAINAAPANARVIHRYVLRFGSWDDRPSLLVVFARTLDQCLPAVGAWLEVNDRRHFVDADVAADAARLVAKGETEEDAWQTAESAVTIVGDHYIPHHSWHVVSIDPSNAALGRLAKRAGPGLAKGRAAVPPAPRKAGRK